MLPEASQARKAIWDAINPHTGKRRIDEAFPQEERRRTRNNEMFIRFENGSTWQVVGSDNYDSLVGSPPVGIVFSEWALAKPDAWTYLRPILAENGGWAIFIWTPRGRNHATRAFEARERDPNWFTQRSTALETGVFTVEQLDRERQELIDEAGSEEEGDAKFRQEYLVDFDAAVPGSYFGAQIKLATDEGRIGAFGHVPSMKVDTAWDIGVDDYTADLVLPGQRQAGPGDRLRRDLGRGARHHRPELPAGADPGPRAG
jgi:phage terminase large subunit